MENHSNESNFRPSSATLIVMGVLVLLSGLSVGFYGLYILATPYIMKASISMEGELSNSDKLIYEFFEKNISSSIVLIALSMFVTAILICWLGIGSIMKRRWAAKLLHALGWLIIGTAFISLIYVLLSIPLVADIPNLAGSLFPGSVPMGNKEMIIVWIALIIYTAIGVVSSALPGVLLVIFYGRKNVELTTQLLNPKPSWTDHVHFKVLILWLTFIACIIWAPYGYAIIHSLSKHNSIENAQTYYIAFSILNVFSIPLCVGIARLHAWSWWGSLTYVTINIALTYLFFNDINIDLKQLIHHIGFKETSETEDSEVNELLGIFEFIVEKFVRSAMMVSIVTLLSIGGLIIYIRKDFFRTQRAN